MVGIERMETGISGLDELIEGGLVRNSMNLLADKLVLGILLS